MIKNYSQERNFHFLCPDPFETTFQFATTHFCLFVQWKFRKFTKFYFKITSKWKKGQKNFHHNPLTFPLAKMEGSNLFLEVPLLFFLSRDNLTMTQAIISMCTHIIFIFAHCKNKVSNKVPHILKWLINHGVVELWPHYRINCFKFYVLPIDVNWILWAEAANGMKKSEYINMEMQPISFVFTRQCSNYNLLYWLFALLTSLVIAFQQLDEAI